MACTWAVSPGRRPSLWSLLTVNRVRQFAAPSTGRLKTHAFRAAVVLNELLRARRSATHRAALTQAAERHRTGISHPADLSAIHLGRLTSSPRIADKNRPHANALAVRGGNMDFWSSMRLLARWWYVVLLGLIVTACRGRHGVPGGPADLLGGQPADVPGVAGGAGRGRGRASGQIADNPLLELGGGYNVLAELIAKIMNGAQGQLAVQEAGGDGDYVVDTVPGDAPVVSITVEATSPEAALGTEKVVRTVMAQTLGGPATRGRCRQPHLRRGASGVRADRSGLRTGQPGASRGGAARGRPRVDARARSSWSRASPQRRRHGPDRHPANHAPPRWRPRRRKSSLGTRREPVRPGADGVEDRRAPPGRRAQGPRRPRGPDRSTSSFSSSCRPHWSSARSTRRPARRPT